MWITWRSVRRRHFNYTFWFTSGEYRRSRFVLSGKNGSN